MKIVSSYASILLPIIIIFSTYVSAEKVDELSLKKITPLHALIVQQFSHNDEKIEKIRQLLDSGADVNALDEIKRTPLLLATFYGVEPAIIDLLIQYGADVTVQDIFNETPLHNAAARDDKITAQLLLDAGGAMKQGTIKKMISFQDDAQDSPLDIAKTPEMDEILLTHE